MPGRRFWSFWVNYKCSTYHNIWRSPFSPVLNENRRKRLTMIKTSSIALTLFTLCFRSLYSIIYNNTISGFADQLHVTFAACADARSTDTGCTSSQHVSIQPRNVRTTISCCPAHVDPVSFPEFGKSEFGKAFTERTAEWTAEPPHAPVGRTFRWIRLSWCRP